MIPLAPALRQCIDNILDFPYDLQEIEGRPHWWFAAFLCQKRSISSLKVLTTQIWGKFAGKYEFSVVIGDCTSVQYNVKLFQFEYKENRRTDSEEHKENTYFPHGTQIQPSPKIIDFLWKSYRTNVLTIF